MLCLRCVGKAAAHDNRTRYKRTENTKHRKWFRGISLRAQRRTQLTANGDGGVLNARLSKSATDLSLREHDDDEEQGRTSVADSSGGQSAPCSRLDGATDRMTVSHRTTSFFNMLKARFARSRSRERRRRPVPPVPGESTPGEMDTPPPTSKHGHRSRHRHDSGTTDYDYAADNSSEQEPSSSLSATPAASPRRALGRKVSGAKGPEAVAGSSRTAEASMQDSSSAVAIPPNQTIVSAREMALRQHAFFQLFVHLKQGRDLVAKDSCGTSDPYVKVKVSGRMMYKSKTVYRHLNPLWDETFTIPIEDPFAPVQVKVFDYDWGLQDDFMGTAFIDLTKLDLNKPTDLTLNLTEPGKSDYSGQVTMSVTLQPKTQEDKEQYFQRGAKLAEVQRRLKSQIWSCVVTVVLVEGRNLLPMDVDGMSDPYCKFRLGNEKYKSRVAFKTLNPSWLEQFDLHLYDDGSHELEVTVWDRDSRAKDDFMGRCTIDLSQLEREKTHRLYKELEDGAGSLFLLLTISGTTASETISDLTSYGTDPREIQNVFRRYGMLGPGPTWQPDWLEGAGVPMPDPEAIMRSFYTLRDVGHLSVKVYRAQGLAAADLGGKSDPFCVLELVNARLQTQTEYKTLCPNWQKIFTFNVKDINSVLEVTVYDEDRDHKSEFLGKVAIPLLRIHNGEKRWYALKDKKLVGRAKGTSPQILLEMTLIWNPIRASIRTFNPKEEKYMQGEVKFKRQVFLKNVMRLKAIIFAMIDTGKFIQSCFEWESTARSLTAFAVFLVICYCFEPYMLPVALLLIFLKNYLVLSITGGRLHKDDEEDIATEDEDDDDDKDKEEKKSLKERLQAVQEVTQSVQNAIGFIASLCESVRNTFNFTVPFLSWLAIMVLSLGAVLLYVMPVRYLVMLWGVNKFLRKLLFPHAVPNNEVLDFLSRIPDDEDLITFRELKVHAPAEIAERRRDQRKKKQS